MKRIITIAFSFALLANICNAQDISIARAATIGSTVTLNGLAINAEGEINDPIIYFQDATAGIAVYEWDIVNNETVQRGDDITITGELVDYNGLLEITNVTSYTVNSTGNALQPTQLVTPAQLSDNYESELIRIDNVVFATGGVTMAGSTNYAFTANGESGEIRINSGSPLVGELVPTSPIDLIAICSEYSGTYQLLPRGLSDFILTSSINFTTALGISNITTSSIDFDWQTDANGSTNMNYGLTPSMGTHVNLGGSSTVHNLPLSGLTDAAIYYVEAYSVAGSDTAFSGMKVVSTASLSSGEINVIFNGSVDNTVSSITDADYSGAFPDSIVAFIDKAMITLDVCVYNCDNVNIIGAINDALNRGVAVRYISDLNTSNFALSGLDNAINVQKGNTEGIMHNKFVIVDRDDVMNARVLSGSTNWTPNNLYDDFNNIITIQDQSIARAYTMEFEEMWGSTTLTPGTGAFGPDKVDNTPHQFNVNGTLVEVYFSPSDGTTNKILNSINSSDADLEIAMLSFTRNDLGQATLDAHNANVDVKVVMESENDQGSEFLFLQGAGVDIQSHMGITYQIHHKYAIIDATDGASDPLVLTGSHNWSTAAETKNDENTMFIHDHVIANKYLEEFMRRYHENSASPIVSEGIVDISCNNMDDASIDLSTVGGASPYTYLWNGGQTSNSLSALSAGTYSYTVTDNNGIDTSGAVVITNPSVLVLSTSITDANCGLDNGSVVPAVSGGTTPYDYLWLDGGVFVSNNWELQNMPGGTYDLTITDAHGCNASNANVVGPGAAFTSTFASTDATACGVADGTASLTTSSGTSPYVYTWDNGSTLATATGLAFGSYGGTITDAAGCWNTYTALISEVGGPTLAITATDILCAGSANGTATVTASGATAYSYMWSEGSTTALASGLTDGEYWVTVSAGACNALASISVGIPDSILLDITVTDASCFGDTDGAYVCAAIGGAGSFSYAWSDGVNAAGSTGGAGVYCVTVTDANACEVQECITVSEPDVIAIIMTTTDISCNGNNDGTATASVSGGVGPYTYLWDNADAAASASGFSSGNHMLTLTDANGCSTEEGLVITEPLIMSLSFLTVDALCDASTDGEISVSPSGGTAPYTFLWGSASTDSNQVNMPGGSYTVFVTDGNGCIVSGSATIDAPDPLLATITVTLPTSGCDYGLEVFTEGGTSGYTYTWSNGATTPQTTNTLDTNLYTVTVTDMNGCTIIASDGSGCTDGISELNTNVDFTIYPNPSNGEFTVFISASERLETTLSIHDLTGKLITNLPINSEMGEKFIKLNELQLPKGVYVFKLESGVKVKRLIIH